MNQVNRVENKIIRVFRVQEEQFFGQKIIQNSAHASPDFMIIGAAKSGTTSLFQYLAQHPQIIEPSIKEIKYFSMNAAIKGLKHYLTYFPLKKIKENKLTFEATPTYLFLPKVPDQIARLYPNMKFIAILRDPVKRAFSHWNSRNDDSFTEHRSLMHDNRSFEEAVWAELNNKDRVPPPSQYLAKGEYSTQIKNWYRHFPKENILLLDFDDLKNNVKSLLKEVTTFLEIPYSYTEFQESDQRINGHIFTKDEPSKNEIKTYNTTPYKTKITVEMQELLRHHFQPFDEELLKITGKKFGWMNSSVPKAEKSY